MKVSSRTERSWNGRRLNVKRLDPNERDTKIRDAIARRAFQISESRGRELGHQLEDWRRAESETVRPLNCGYLISDGKIELNTDAACFADGEIAVCVEPRRLTICGRKAFCKSSETLDEGNSKFNGYLIFRSLDLPVEIEPSQVTATFKGRTIEIDLPKSRAIEKVHAENNAA